MYTSVLVVCRSFSILKNMQILGLILIGRNLTWSVPIGREHFTTGAPHRNPLLSLKCADFGALSDWSRAVSPPVAPRVIPYYRPDALFCCNIVARGRYGSIVPTVLIGREQSRVTYNVTAPPLLSKMRTFWGTVLR